MNFIVKNDGKGSPLLVYRGIVLAIVMMFLVSPLFDFGFKVTTAMTDGVLAISNMNSDSEFESTISQSIVRAMIHDDQTKEENINYFVDNWKTADINEVEVDDNSLSKVYKYSLSLFILLIISFITIFLLFYIAIQMAKRVMEIALYKIIAPFCCTSLTNNGRAFETWVKSTIGLFVVTVVQFVSIGLMLNMFGSAFHDSGLIVGLFLIIGALLFIIGTPTIINSLLGQQSGLMSAFGDIQSMIALSS